MLTDKQKAANQKSWQHLGRKLRCTKCGLLMRDCEPMQESGEFHHYTSAKRARCDNDNKTFDWEVYRGPGRVQPIRDHGIQQVLPKKYRRAQKRGARLASKHRG